MKNDVILAAQPTKQFVTTEQVAALAVFLASDAAKSITGALPADGWRLVGGVTRTAVRRPARGPLTSAMPCAACSIIALRYCAGGNPNSRLNARLNAASDS